MNDHQTTPQEDDSYLYHYTTVDAFISIVEKQELWASNIFYLNDSAEVHLAITLARELLKAEIDDESDAARRARLEDVAKSLDEPRLGTVVKPLYFVCCFSEEEDDLNQWRSYCRTGGVAIGLRRGDLLDLAGNQGLKGPGFAPQLVRCIYEEEEQRKVIRLCIKKAAGVMPGGTFGASMSPEEIDQLRANLLLYILASQPIKHKNFRGEKEWRLIVQLDPGMREDKRRGFRSHNGLIIPYWKIYLDPYEKEDRRIWAKVRVTVGPTPHPQELKASVEDLLQALLQAPRQSGSDLKTSRELKSHVLLLVISGFPGHDR